MNIFKKLFGKNKKADEESETDAEAEIDEIN